MAPNTKGNLLSTSDCMTLLLILDSLFHCSIKRTWYTTVTDLFLSLATRLDKESIFATMQTEDVGKLIKTISLENFSKE